MFHPQHQQYPRAYGNNPNVSGMSMGMGMPMMGIAATGTVFNNVFMYSGNPVGLQSRLESLTAEEAAMIR